MPGIKIKIYFLNANNMLKISTWTLYVPKLKVVRISCKTRFNVDSKWSSSWTNDVKYDVPIQCWVLYLNYNSSVFHSFSDISDLDTNLPRIDIEAIENHLRLAREEERKVSTWAIGMEDASNF
jgi:hypothetical protein